MQKKVKNPRNKTGLWHAGIIWAVMLTLWGAVLVQCTRRPAQNPANDTVSLQRITREGYAFEHLATPEQQLQYTRTWFTDPKEKRVALELLIELFPQAKSIRAQAELELAYLALGDDYRFTDPAACRRALEKYGHIASEYTDLQSVCAKAHWYMGWIYADLLKQPRKAIEHYQVVVKRYPEALLNLKPPVPWVELVLPQAIKKPMAVYEYPAYKWSSIALLEIIRNSDNEEEQWHAFEKLWSDDPTSLTVGYAVRKLVNGSPSLALKVALRTGVHFKDRPFSRPMAEDVRRMLQSLKINGDLQKQ